VDHQFFLNALYVFVKHDIKRPKQCISSKSRHHRYYITYNIAIDLREEDMIKKIVAIRC